MSFWQRFLCFLMATSPLMRARVNLSLHHDLDDRARGAVEAVGARAGAARAEAGRSGRRARPACGGAGDEADHAAPSAAPSAAVARAARSAVSARGRDVHSPGDALARDVDVAASSAAASGCTSELG